MRPIRLAMAAAVVAMAAGCVSTTPVQISLVNWRTATVHVTSVMATNGTANASNAVEGGGNGTATLPVGVTP